MILLPPRDVCKKLKIQRHQFKNLVAKGVLVPTEVSANGTAYYDLKAVEALHNINLRDYMVSPLTTEEVLEIYDLLHDGYLTMKEIGERFKINEEAVTSIGHGKTYKFLYKKHYRGHGVKITHAEKIKILENKLNVLRSEHGEAIDIAIAVSKKLASLTIYSKRQVNDNA